MVTSSVMMMEARRPISSGGIREPRRLGGPAGASEDFLGSGVFSLTTAILGASGAFTCGFLISGTVGLS